MRRKAHQETEYLDAAMRRLEHDAALRERADAELRAVASQEPLIAESLRTPQSPPHHCEGPAMDSHLRRILTVVYALVGGKLRLLDIEEFRRLKGYEGKIQDLEETIKENAALFECFALCHDAAKWATLSFTSLPGSRGAALGFETEPMAHWHDIGVSERAKLRARYLELYDMFASERAQEPPRASQQAFFDAYGIQCHYPGHDRAVHTPNYHGLLHRVCDAHRLTDRDAALLEEVIAHHLDAFEDFSRRANPARIDRLQKLATDRGFDGDDLIGLMQAALLLDGVCGSARHSPHGGVWHDPTPLIHFLRAEHDYAPWKRAEKEKRRAEDRTRDRNRRFRKAGLDGLALMDLLKMEPGPKFGRALAVIHAAVLGEVPWPKLPEDKKKELEKRATRFYALEFEKDGDGE
ncbi:hypothetical protein EPO34_03000 [Patescibacteria group bacterium]|nr:MAG: hypothetical protein EPO34_03000 [Patescibacteria group bacterium]